MIVLRLLRDALILVFFVLGVLAFFAVGSVLAETPRLCQDPGNQPLFTPRVKTLAPGERSRKRLYTLNYYVTDSDKLRVTPEVLGFGRAIAVGPDLAKAKKAALLVSQGLFFKEVGLPTPRLKPRLESYWSWVNDVVRKEQRYCLRLGKRAGRCCRSLARGVKHRPRWYKGISQRPLGRLFESELISRLPE